MKDLSVSNPNKRLRRVWATHLGHGDSLSDNERIFYDEMFAIAKRSNSILEIGAGRGRMARILRSSGVEADMVNLDFNEFVTEAPGYSVIGDARFLPFKDGTFDLVYSLGVIEHFPESEASISEHIRVAKPGACVIVTTPRFSLFTILRGIAWLAKYRKIGSYQETVGRNLSLKIVRKWLVKSGGVLANSGVGGYFLPSYSKYIKPLISIILPADIFGAYLWCIAVRPSQKTALDKDSR